MFLALLLLSFGVAFGTEMIELANDVARDAFEEEDE